MENSWFIIACSFEDEDATQSNLDEMYWQNYSKKYKSLRRAKQALVFLEDDNRTCWIMSKSGSGKETRSKMIFRILPCIPPISQQERVRLKIYNR